MSQLQPNTQTRLSMRQLLSILFENYYSLSKTTIHLISHESEDFPSNKYHIKINFLSENLIVERFVNVEQMVEFRSKQLSMKIVRSLIKSFTHELGAAITIFPEAALNSNEVAQSTKMIYFAKILKSTENINSYFQ